MRCVHEAKLFKENAFVTLTYDEDHMPTGGQLVYSDFQKFMKRLRKQFPQRTIRFYMCGEYGPQLQRPHFHACLFGVGFTDKTKWTDTLYRSETLEKLWTSGYSTIGEVTFETAAYTARYCMKKITGKNAKYHYGELTPEFNHMSLKPGIGKKFLEKWETDIYPNDYVVINGMETKPPKYYDKIYKKNKPQSYEEIQFKRETEGRKNYEDNTERRLKDKEIVANAKVSKLRRQMQEY